MASLPLLVPQEQLGRANGLVQFAQAGAQIIAPVLAGILVLSIQLHGVIVIDLVSFVFAVGTLGFARIPKPEPSVEGQAGQGSLLHEALYGWSYIWERPGLLGLLIFYTTTNLLLGMVFVLAMPLVLSFASAAMYGTVASIGGEAYYAEA